MSVGLGLRCRALCCWSSWHELQRSLSCWPVGSLCLAIVAVEAAHVVECGNHSPDLKRLSWFDSGVLVDKVVTLFA